MENILNVTGGKFELDKTNNRFVITISEINTEHFKQLLDGFVQGVETYKLENCLVYVTNPTGTFSKETDFGAQRFQSAMVHGLKKVAFVVIGDDENKTIGNNYVSKISRGETKAFSDRDQASAWLGGTKGGRKAA